MDQKMMVNIEGLEPRLVIGDPDKTTVASDGSGLLVYVQDVETGSMIRVGKQYLTVVATD